MPPKQISLLRQNQLANANFSLCSLSATVVCVTGVAPSPMGLAMLQVTLMPRPSHVRRIVSSWRLPNFGRSTRTHAAILYFVYSHPSFFKRDALIKLKMPRHSISGSWQPPVAEAFVSYYAYTLTAVCVSCISLFPWWWQSCRRL